MSLFASADATARNRLLLYDVMNSVMQAGNLELQAHESDVVPLFLSAQIKVPNDAGQERSGISGSRDSCLTS